MSLDVQKQSFLFSGDSTWPPRDKGLLLSDLQSLTSIWIDDTNQLLIGIYWHQLDFNILGLAVLHTGCLQNIQYVTSVEQRKNLST